MDLQRIARRFVLVQEHGLNLQAATLLARVPATFQ